MAADRFYCSGTEPFWSMVAAQDQFTFQQSDKPALNFEPLKPMQIQYVTRTNLQVYKSKSLADKKPAMAIFQKIDCSDGMSDHKYNYQVIFIYNDTVHRGCCELRQEPKMEE